MSRQDDNVYNILNKVILMLEEDKNKEALVLLKKMRKVGKTRAGKIFVSSNVRDTIKKLEAFTHNVT